jgi:cytochrome b subunit of formate dehydrogenase
MSGQVISEWGNDASASQRVVRHRLVDRLYHWLMAIAVFVLIGTAFLPILGIKFAWLDIHWITGLGLALLVLIHIVRALVWQDWRSMWIGFSDLRDIWRGVAAALGGRGARPARPGKYDAAQKLYHLGIAVLVLSAVTTGLLMLLKIDTPFWRRNPYWFSADTWGIIYAIHGLAAMAIVATVIVHIYFALRPDEWHLTRSMFRGWISRKEYLEHHDTERWKA